MNVVIGSMPLLFSSNDVVETATRASYRQQNSARWSSKSFTWLPLLLLATTLAVAPAKANWATIQDQEGEATEQAEQSADETSESSIEWMTDISAAMEKAKAEKKDLLFNFTGSDWCVWCIRLEQEVFSQAEFAPASDKFVFVKLDFPRDKSGLSEETQAQNEEWQSKLEVSGFPTIYLMDAQGRPYAKSGYQQGGPEPYLQKLTELQTARIERDELLAKADEAEGDEAAKLLDQAISKLDESLATTFYEELIKRIVELDPDDSTGLRTKYYAAQDAETRKRILARIELAARTQSPELAVKTIDESLGEFPLPPHMKIAALQTKLRLLRRAGDDEAVMQLLDQMIEIDGIPPETRHQLVIQKVYNMVGAEEEEQAIEMLDNLISSTISNLDLCIAKGELFGRLGRYDQAIDAYDYVIRSGVKDQERLAEIIIAKSDVLASMDKTEDAIQLLEDFASNSKTEGYLKSDVYIAKAMLLREIGDKDGAELAEHKAVQFADGPEAREELLKVIEQIRKTFKD